MACEVDCLVVVQKRILRLSCQLWRKLVSAYEAAGVSSQANTWAQRAQNVIASYVVAGLLLSWVAVSLLMADECGV
ncbi:hypothetical protein BSPWISOXPB_4737 [uncultured Gammaproteobacteria bacterium]|nr:hypothetical protein BSPWISOXPB_4737 [uncultured Gammaproteobacteria bacterium]